MALVLTVGSPHAVFSDPHSTTVAETLRLHFGSSIDFDSQEERSSSELGWSGWSSLQQRAAELLGPAAIPQLLSIEAWCGAYLPVDTPIGTFEFPGKETNLDVGCLQQLVFELEQIGKYLNLPVDDAGLDTLFHKYAGNDDIVDNDMDIQTFTQLLPLARFALAHRLPLWIVK